MATASSAWATARCCWPRAFLFLFTQGIAARGAINGDVFVVSAIGGVIVIVATFVFFPIAKMLIAAFITEDGGYSVAVFAAKFFDDRLWGLGCLSGIALRRRLEFAVPRHPRRR